MIQSFQIATDIKHSYDHIAGPAHPRDLGDAATTAQRPHRSERSYKEKQPLRPEAGCRTSVHRDAP